jgi:hypothetical protein
MRRALGVGTCPPGPAPILDNDRRRHQSAKAPQGGFKPDTAWGKSELVSVPSAVWREPHPLASTRLIWPDSPGEVVVFAILRRGRDPSLAASTKNVRFQPLSLEAQIGTVEALIQTRGSANKAEAAKRFRPRNH